MPVVPVLWSACRNRVPIVTACTCDVGLKITASGKMRERCRTVPVLWVTTEAVVMSLHFKHLTRNGWCMYQLPVLLSSCVAEKWGVNKKGVNQKYFHKI